MMRRVHVVPHDICNGHCDLTIVPCSGKMKREEKPRNQARIDTYGLPTPYDLREKFSYGKVSPIFSPTKNAGKIKYFAFAASALNKSDPGAIEYIGKQLGKLTCDNRDIRLVEAPFLGCGDGGLHPSAAMRALAEGFLSTSHPKAILQLCSDSASSVRAATLAINELFDQLAKTSVTGQAPRRKNKRDTFEYDFVLSFAREQRLFVYEVAELLKAGGARIFYDNDETDHLWGRNLFDYLYEVYSKKSRYCVIFVSEDYNRKEWTNHERKAAQERAFREKEEGYILPIRVDGTSLPSLPSTVGYIRSKLGSDRIVELLLRKLK